MIKSAKRSTIVSAILAIMLCISLIAGGTYAWFTDTASSSVSKVQAGTLDIALEDEDGASLEGKMLSWVAHDKRSEIYWEPGCTYNTQPFYIHNKGNLNLKFKVIVSGITGDVKLAEVINFTAMAKANQFHFNTEAISVTVDEDEEFDLLKGYTVDTIFYGEQHFTEYVLEPGEKVGPVAVSGHMDEGAGNVYQGLSIDGIAITLAATQATGDEDSYNGVYDENATYPEVSYAAVTTTKDLSDAIVNSKNADGEATDKVVADLTTAGETTVNLENGIANGGDKSREVTFIGNGEQTVDVVEQAVSAEGGKLNYQCGSSFIFENLTIQAGEGNFDGIVCDELTYKNCTIKGKLTLFGKATFIDCTFENDMQDQYSVWTWGGTDVTFEGCTFNTNGKAILLYGQATAEKPTNLVVNNCTFNDRNNGSAGKAAIEIGNDYNATYTLTINNATVKGFAVNSKGTSTNSKLWANKNSMDAEHLTVTIDGKKVQ